MFNNMNYHAVTGMQTPKSPCQRSKQCNLDGRSYEENRAEATEPKQLLITEFRRQNSTAIFVSRAIHLRWNAAIWHCAEGDWGFRAVTFTKNTRVQRQLLVLMLLLTLDVLINSSSFWPSRAFCNGQYAWYVDPANEKKCMMTAPPTGFKCLQVNLQHSSIGCSKFIGGKWNTLL